VHQSERAFRAHATGPQVKRRAGLTGSCCRGAGHDEGEKEGSKGLPGRNSLSPLFAFFAWAVLHSDLFHPYARGFVVGRLQSEDGLSNSDTHEDDSVSLPPPSRYRAGSSMTPKGGKDTHACTRHAVTTQSSRRPRPTGNPNPSHHTTSAYMAPHGCTPLGVDCTRALPAKF
jgi:hypothetical protein